jgi:hypothetical protein
MAKEELSVKQSVGNLYYGWEKDGGDLFLHLGFMRKALVITTLYSGNKFKISERSFFPFPSAFYDEKFITIEEAKKRAIDYILGWLNDTNISLNLV